MGPGRLAKDVQYLQRHIDSQTNGQATVEDVDDNLEFMLLNVLPNDGFYKGAKLRFKIYFTDGYPHDVPRVHCLDKVYHPNIDPSQEEEEESECSNVCVSLLDSWEPEMGLDHLVMALLFLMYNPNPEDALSPYFDEYIDMDSLKENIQITLRGENLEGISWPRLLVEDVDDVHEDGVNKEDVNEDSVNKDKVNEDVRTLSDEIGLPDWPDVGEVGAMSRVNPDVWSQLISEEDSGTPVDAPAPNFSSGDSDSDSDSENVVVDQVTSASASSGNESNYIKTSLTDTDILNHHNSALTEAFAQNCKLCPVIFMDEMEVQKAVDCECELPGIGRRSSWTGFGASRMKALFSCFCGSSATLKVPVTRTGEMTDGVDGDVD